MRSLPLLLAAGLFATACSAAVVDDDLAIGDAAAPQLDTAPTAQPETGTPDTLARVALSDLTEACTITTDAPSGDVRLPFPEGWIVGECGFFDPDEVILEEGSEPQDVDIRWYVDPIWFPTATELGDDDHARITTTVSGLPAMRIRGEFPDDHASSPGMHFTTWYVDLSAGQESQAQILVGSVIEGEQIDYDGSVRVLDLMARGLAAQNPYEVVGDETHAIALRTRIQGAQATVTYDEGACLTLRNGGAAGSIVSQACDLSLMDDDAIKAVRLRWDDDLVVVAGFARTDVTYVEATFERDGDAQTVGAIPVDNDNGPNVFAILPISEDDLPTMHAVDGDGEVIVKFDGDEVE